MELFSAYLRHKLLDLIYNYLSAVQYYIDSIGAFTPFKVSFILWPSIGVQAGLFFNFPVCISPEAAPASYLRVDGQVGWLGCRNTDLSAALYEPVLSKGFPVNIQVEITGIVYLHPGSRGQQ